MWRRALVAWVVLLLLAVMNGAVRDTVLTPAFGAQAAHIVSTAILAIVIVVVAFLSRDWIGARHDREAFRVGLRWTVLVLGFAFLAGHFPFGRSWPYVLADYDLLAGRIWIAVPLVTLLAPLCVARLAATR